MLCDESGRGLGGCCGAATMTGVSYEGYVLSTWVVCECDDEAIAITPANLT